MAEAPLINLPTMCQKHQALLVQQANWSEQDPWRALIIVAQIVLFQAATAHPSTYEQVGGDVQKIADLGCLACYRPDAFGEIVEAAKSHDLGQVKAVGERWIAAAAKP